MHFSSIKIQPSLRHLLWVFPLMLFLPTLLSGQALVWGTPSLQFIPWRWLAWEQLTHGVWPYWNPLNGMGAPLLANYQLALYYPPGWLLFLLQSLGGSSWMAWGYTLLLVAHLVWAAYGMARLVRQLGFSELAQVIAGLAFSLSGYLVARGGFFSMIWSAAWLPWLILCIDRLDAASTRSQRLAAIGWLGLCAGMQLLSGHAQLTWYSLILAGCWALTVGWARRGWKGAGQTAGLALLGILIGACLAGVQLIPTFELLSQSQRAAAVNYDTAMTYSFWPWRLVTLLAPSFFGNPAFGDYWGYASFWEDAAYIGLMPCILALSTVRIFWRRNEILWPLRLRLHLLWIMSLVGLIFALGKNTPIFPFLYRHVPTFDMFQAPARYMLWPVFSLSLLSAAGLDAMKRPVGKVLHRLRRVLFAIFAGLIGAGTAYFVLPGIKPSFIYSFAIACLLGLLTGWLALKKPGDVESPGQKRWAWLAASLVGLDLLLSGWGQNPATPASFYAPSTDTADLAQLTAAGRLYLDAQSEYQLKFNRFLRFGDYRPRESWENMREAQIPNLNIVNGVSSVNNFDPLRPARYEEWMLYLSTLPAADREPWLQMMDVSRVEFVTDKNETAYTVQSLSGGVRFSFHSCAVAANSPEDAWEKTRETIENGVDRVIIEGMVDSSFPCDLHSDDKISILSEQATRIELDVETGQDGWLVMADTWYPGWRASIDGQTVPISRANYVFRGLHLPAGRHSVVIEYRPWWIWPATGLSLLGILSIAILLFLGRKKQHPVNWSSNGRLDF